MFSRATITLGIGPHSSSFCFHNRLIDGDNAGDDGRERDRAYDHARRHGDSRGDDERDASNDR